MNKVRTIFLLLAVVLSVIVVIKILNFTVAENPIKTEVQRPGSVTSPEITSNYLCVGGVCRYYYRVAARNIRALTDTGAVGTSTICAIKSPAATSTLVSASVALSTGATTTAILDMAKSANDNATTTQIGNTISLTAGQKVYLVASTTPTAGEVTTFPPSYYFIVKMAQLGNSFSPAGYCNTVFEIQ